MTAHDVDPISLEVFRHRCAAIAEEMGAALGRSAFSANIKERRDFSCAVFDASGRMIAQAAHIPVHLGAMPRSDEAALAHHRLAPGDIVLLNDPYLGGTHLPDLTTVAPVFAHERLIGYTATRAHHADIGGMVPGSMPMSRELYQEGLIIPPVKLAEGGALNETLVALICRNSRTPDERRGDLAAQLACHQVGAQRLEELAARHGLEWVRTNMQALLDYGERHMRALLTSIPDGDYVFEDALDDDGVGSGPLPIRVRVTIAGDTATIDFAGSAPQCRGPLNAPPAVVESAVLYCFRCLGPPDMPASAGAFAPLTILVPEGSILCPYPPAPVAGGNVETSQRIVDTLLRALARALPARIPAASQGTMNNLTIGGIDPRTGLEFAYYETVAGGMGARPRQDGMSAVHTHMTNSLNTPAEALEYAYPLRVRAYSIRKNSGGRGHERGGDGVVREIETLARARMSLLADRRRRAPYGLAGGEDGKTGRDSVLRNGRARAIASKGSWQLEAGDRVRIETPGGGGHGRKKR